MFSIVSPFISNLNYKFQVNIFFSCRKKLTNSIKKLSNSWEHASNYVAKCYMDPEIPRERYFDDVKLQMDAKLWRLILFKYFKV